MTPDFLPVGGLVAALGTHDPRKRDLGPRRPAYRLSDPLEPIP